MENNLEQSISYIKSHTDDKPRLGVILGSGLGAFADRLNPSVKIATKDIPFFPKSTVQGHQGYLVFGGWQGVNVTALQGRTHHYEGYGLDKVTYVVRIFKSLGVRILIITNAAGGLNPLFSPNVAASTFPRLFIFNPKRADKSFSVK